MRSRLSVLLLSLVMMAGATAAQSPSSFTVEQILGFPSPDNLIASPAGSTIAWTFNERGVRNIYIATGPSFEARRVTAYADDDGQELTQLAFSRDGKSIRSEERRVGKGGRC